LGRLGRRDFRLPWVGETASGLGNSITLVTLPLTAVVAGAGAPAVGLLAAAVWLPWLLVGLPMGAWVDRARKRPLLVACDLVSATALASVPVAAWLGVLTLAQLVAVALVAGTVAVWFSTAYHAYIPVALDGRDLLAATPGWRAPRPPPRRSPGRAPPGCSRRRSAPRRFLVVDDFLSVPVAVCIARDVTRPDPERVRAHRILQMRDGEPQA